jgi:hypothetical protein
MMGHGRLYTVCAENVSVTAQQDLAYVKPAADKMVFIERVKITVVGGSADAGDAQEELLDIQYCYVPATVTASSGGSSNTPKPNNINDTAASFTARTNDTTKATTTGTITTFDAPGLNSRVGMDDLLPPEHRMPITNAAAFTVRLNTTPADALAVNVTVWVRELP